MDHAIDLDAERYRLTSGMLVEKVESVGLTWHSLERPYWNESAYYELTAKEVDVLEAATNELEKMTLGQFGKARQWSSRTETSSS